MRRTRNIGVAIAAFTLALACGTTDPAQPFSGRVASTAVWSGGEVTIIGAALAAPALPDVALDGQPLSVRWVNDSTVAARLPDGDGARTLRVELAAHVPFEASLTLFGFRSAETGPFLTGFLQAVPGGPWVLGAGDSGLVEIDVRTNAVRRSWGDSIHSPDCTWGVGPSVRPGHYVLFGKNDAGQCARAVVWQYGATLTRVDSTAARADEWSIAEIGPGGWIMGSDDAFTISQCGAQGCAPVDYTPFAGSLTGVTIGHQAHRAVLHSFFGWVVNATTGDTLPRSSAGAGYHVEGAAFSAAEDTAWLAASTFASGGRVYLLDAASGVRRDSVNLAARALDIGRDTARPWLYIAVFNGPTAAAVPELLVLDQGTLDTIAVLRAPASEALSLTQWHQFRIVLDPTMNAVYVVATAQVYDAHGLRSRVLRFGVVPPP
jgi:hypothetical protein